MQKGKAAEKGLSVDEKLFPSIVPIDAYLRYLESLVQEWKSDKFCQYIKFKDAVPGAVHEVDSPRPVIDAYLKALFE